MGVPRDSRNEDFTFSRRYLLQHCLYSRSLSFVQTWPGSTCTDACVENMKNEVEMSAGFSNYKDYVKKKFDEFIWSECHNCIYIYCGLVHQSYGISMTNEICRY